MCVPAGADTDTQDAQAGETPNVVAPVAHTQGAAVEGRRSVLLLALVAAEVMAVAGVLARRRSPAGAHVGERPTSEMRQLGGPDGRLVARAGVGHQAGRVGIYQLGATTAVGWG